MKIIQLDVYWIMFDLSKQKSIRCCKSNSPNNICWVIKEKLHNNDNSLDASNDQSIFVLTILKKLKKSILKFSQGSVTVL